MSETLVIIFLSVFVVLVLLFWFFVLPAVAELCMDGFEEGFEEGKENA